ncbi:hypothetical protein BDA96_01G155900 [Sorghum bicolor]|uniref:SHSP domain-containing protein n=2 Tax=Sorghum bicolor TaxID=4558 RepID=A0A921UY91_SORBI|nr:inactive protein RESTRICTED TEV MOVEMENT 2 [Sorghum bicolor]EER91130.1 hypothetical protein SORBI_3001G148600 [Sorghum bicolor]KAG0548308.1 hypothetical protein BDA96_01G155900 [Sorghum bicolor]|eukprot:XP_002464132.1 inactive protein RESTRICTED TEV MOVEMENT 2 [Sorghum bicolor]
MANNRTYEEYEPAVEWSRNPEADAVKISLPGFKREDIRVLVDNHGHLRTRGERPIAGNRWIRFQKDFELPANCNADGIRAKFENERLTITLPKNTPLPPMPAPPKRPPHMAAAVPEPPVRPTVPLPTVPAAPLAPAPPAVKPPVEPRPSMSRKTYAPVPAPAPEVEPPAITKPQSSLGAVQRQKEEEEKQRVREAEGKMAEDRKKEMAQEKATEQQQEEEAMPRADSMGMAALQRRPASGSRGLLVNVAVAVAVLLGITVYVWHSLKNATGGAGEHGHGHLGAGSYRDEM